MESYEVLNKAIPKKASARVAQLLNISATYVRRWRNQPESDENPDGNGQRSILDRICDLIDAVFLVNPCDVGLIVEHVNDHYQNLINTHAAVIDCHQTRAEQSADLLREAVEAVNKLSVEGCSADTIVELVQLRDAADRAIKSVEKTLKLEAQNAA